MKNILLAALALTGLFVMNCKKKETNAPVYPSDCAHKLAGIYVGNDYCSSSSPSYASSITGVGDSISITFSNLGGSGPVTAVLDCDKNTITIPTQTFPGNFSISGTGTYTANRIIINWSGLSYGIPVNCSSTLTR